MESSNPAPVSVRFNTKQKKLLDQAAEIRDEPVSVFARNATVVQAVDTLNAKGKQREAIRRLANLVVQQLRDPLMERTKHFVPEPDVTETSHIRASELLYDQEQHEYDGYLVSQGWDLGPWSVKPIDDTDFAQIFAALETSPLSFAELLKDVWYSRGDEVNYRPSIKITDALNDD